MGYYLVSKRVWDYSLDDYEGALVGKGFYPMITLDTLQSVANANAQLSDYLIVAVSDEHLIEIDKSAGIYAADMRYVFDIG